MGGKLKQILAGLSAAFGAFCLGSSIGWSGPVEIPVMSGSAYPFTPTPDGWGWVSSLLTLGGAFACVPVGVLIKIIGRKLTMLILVLPYLIGWLLIGFARHVSMLFVGRFILGACGGAFCITSPVYTTEIAQIEVRGTMGSFFQLLIVNGVLYGYVVGAFCSVMLINILCGILPIIFFVFFMWMPESPVYLMQRGKTEKAEKVLKWLRNEDADIAGEMAGIAAENNKEKGPMRESMCRKATLKGLFLSIMLMLFQQLTGINAIIFYATSIFVDAGTGFSPSTCTIVIGVVMVLATCVSVFIIDKVGRRILLLISAAGMAISTFIVGVYFQWLMQKNVGWLPVLAVCLFITAFSFGFGPVPWVVMAELFAEDVKTVAGSISGTSNWLFAFCVTKLFPLSVEHVGPAGTFWIFAGVATVGFFFTLFLVPETRGKTLTDIQAELDGSAKASKSN